jgi:hypothetical protein
MKAKLGLFVCGAAAAMSAGAAFSACARHADIRDEPDGSSLDRPPTVEAGGIPVVDSGLETDAFAACSERPVGDCVGTNDFPCAFEGWAIDTAKSCQAATSCKTNGWIEVAMGPEGCVTEIRMDQPNDDILACLVAEFGAVRCPCPAVETSHYFGTGNAGTCPP